MKLHLFVVMGSLLLNGCTNWAEVSHDPNTREVERLAAQSRLNDSAPTCDHESCQKKWDAAQSWVAQNSVFKIQTVSSAIIETYAPSHGDTHLEFNVVKEPSPNGKYSIKIKAYCANWIGCAEAPATAAQRFNDYVNSIK